MKVKTSVANHFNSQTRIESFSQTQTHTHICIRIEFALKIISDLFHFHMQTDLADFDATHVATFVTW